MHANFLQGLRDVDDNRPSKTLHRKLTDIRSPLLYKDSGFREKAHLCLPRESSWTAQSFSAGQCTAA